MRGGAWSVDGLIDESHRLIDVEELGRRHRWEVPARYNIAADVCDKHPRDKQAMVWERFDGAARAALGRAAGSAANAAAHALRAQE